MKPLTIREALTLYDLLAKYLPDTIPKDIDVLEYSNSIVDKIILDEKPEIYVQALSLMSKKSLMELVSINKYERSALFIECLIVNQVWMLREFLRKIGYGDPNR